MGKNSTVLRWSLVAGALYFLGITIAHVLGIRIPGLYIYFDVPSYAYQDRIIASLAFGWSVFLFTAAREPVKNRDLVVAILVAGAGAILGLSVVNLATDFDALGPGVQVSLFWLETLALCGYLTWLLVFYRRSRRETIV